MMPRNPAGVPGKLPELLAPAGSPAAFRAAVAAGADAIYLSGKRFGARKFAANFSDAGIEEAVTYAHAHGVRVYVTVNTLIHDRELAGVMEYLAWLWSVGVDAVLVQDTGIAALAREYLPGLAIHASTQMTVHNADGVRWAGEHRLSRVVLARELPLDEVARIAEETRDTGVGLEVFIHGALCYGYSGQCLLSSVIGGRSGNRGMCAQPCRKPYTLVQGETDESGRPVRLADVPLKERFLLSPRDLCTYHRLPELVRSPVVSLKIEGRMKSPEYVAIVVSTYRQALDAIAAGTWTPSEEAFRDLLLAFNREFTAGYLFGDRYEDLMGRGAPDNRGLPIGRVARYDRKTSIAVIRPLIPVIPLTGDGLHILRPDKPEQELGFALNTSPKITRDGYTLSLPAPVPEGAMVSITSSRDLEARARRIIAKPAPELLRPLPVDLEVTVGAGGSCRISGTITCPDGRHISVSYQPDQYLEPARTQPLSRAQLEEQLRKTGGTPFTVRHFTLDYDGNLFAPVALTNEFRREFFRRAAEQLDAAFRPSPEEVVAARQRLPALPQPSSSRGIRSGDRDGAARLRLSVYTGSPEGVREAAAAGADTICFEPLLYTGRHLCTGRGEQPSPRSQILDALATCATSGTLLVWKLPRIIHDPQLDTLLPELRFLHANGLAACMTGNSGISRAVIRAAPGIALHGSTGLNIWNHIAATRAGIPYALLTLSPELSRDDIRTLTSLSAASGTAPAFSLIIQGSSEAMVTEDCIPRLVRHCRAGGTGDSTSGKPGFLGLRDETGRVFPVRTDGTCRTRIANASELCLVDMLPDISDAGIAGITIDARFRPPSYTGTMVRIYREAIGIAGNDTGTARESGLRRLKERVQEIALGGITAGHFLRGLKE